MHAGISQSDCISLLLGVFWLFRNRLQTHQVIEVERLEKGPVLGGDWLPRLLVTGVVVLEIILANLDDVPVDEHPPSGHLTFRGPAHDSQPHLYDNMFAHGRGEDY